jgi:hypothetical protein
MLLVRVKHQLDAKAKKRLAAVAERRNREV